MGQDPNTISDAVSMLVDLNVLHNFKFKSKLSVITSYTYWYEERKVKIYVSDTEILAKLASRIQFGSLLNSI